MRTFALAATVIAALAVPAVADDEIEDEEDDLYLPTPKLSATAGMQAHGSRVGGRAESGVGLALETAYGRGRWQYLLEGAIATSAKDDGGMDRVDGNQMRGALGLRWIARQFQLDSTGALELFLMTTLGMQRYRHDDGDRLVRPEVTLGFGMQGRKLRNPRFTFRLDARVAFTPNDRDSALVRCRGTCAMDSGTSTGFLMGMTFGW